MLHPALVDSVRIDVARAVQQLVRALETKLPRTAPALAWLSTNRRDVAAALSVATGTILIAAAGGLLG